MKKTIAIIQGHPDSAPHLCHALADAYAAGAIEAGHVVKRIPVAELEFPILRSQAAWETGQLPQTLGKAQQIIAAADHVVILFPLWLGTMPALLKGFLEQVLRPGFAFTQDNSPRGSRPALRGRSARIVVTMGMPALFFRWFYLGHGVKALERNILRFCGFSPIRETFIGAIGNLKTGRYERLSQKLRNLGRKAL